MWKYLTTIALVCTMASPAIAYQTEVDQGTMEWKREGLARWERQQERARAARLVRQRVLSAQPSDPATGSVSVGTQGGIPGIIHDIFGVHGDEAMSVASCESGLDPTAQNPSGASGLFQLMPFHWQGRFDPFDPVANTRYAFGLSNGGTDWGAWEMGVCA